jgi:hypothetical protein
LAIYESDGKTWNALFLHHLGDGGVEFLFDR